MTDDIVTRLRRVPERVPKGMGIVGLNEYYQRCQDAADEIERLRNAIIKIDRAITDEGKVPSYHRAILKRHWGEWPTLHKAIDEARKALRDDIVTRLRNHVRGDFEKTSGFMLRLAADEIERLQKDCDQLWFWVVHLREGSTWCGQREKICDVCQIYEETLPND